MDRPGGAEWELASFLLTLALSLQADLCVMTRLLGYVDPSDPRFVAAVLAITFNPLFWNVVSVLTLILSQRAAQTDEPLFLPLCLRPVWNHLLCFPIKVGTQLGDPDQASPSRWGSHDVLASADGPGLLPRLGWGRRAVL